MSCKKEWDRKFIVNHFNQTFVKTEYTELIKNILFETETALLPATQPYVENKLKIKSLYNNMNLHDKEEERMRARLREIQEYKDGIQHEINVLSNKKVVERREFIRKCPSQTCNGFLSSSLKCGLCNIWACSHCREIKGDTQDAQHTCCPNILANVMAMEKDTKACPKCASMIYKIEGCNQMFCTMCHTAFAWNTLQIQTGPIHNPHYFAWQQTQREMQDNIVVEPLAQQQGVNNCVPELTNQFIHNLRNKISNYTLKTKIYDICRNILHIQEVEISRFRVHIDDNLYLRGRYLMNEITKDEFKRNIQLTDKKTEKRNEITNVLTMFVNSMTDILNRLFQNINLNERSFGDIPERLIEEMHELRKYVNECFKDISKYYNCVEYCIDEKFVFWSSNVLTRHNIQTAEAQAANEASGLNIRR
jgi:hypothetical protein